MIYKSLSVVRDFTFSDEQMAFNLGPFYIVKNFQSIVSEFENFRPYSIGLGFTDRDNFFRFYTIYFNGESNLLSYLPEIDINSQISIATCIDDHFQIILTCLWFVKDNSVNLTKTFILNDENENFNTKELRETNSNASGTQQSVSFSNSEIDKATIFYSKLVSMSNPKTKEFISDFDFLKNISFSGIITGSITAVPYNSLSKIERAFIFLINARRTALLPAKILFYMTIFETLFTTDSFEVSRKISERAAHLLGEGDETKKLIKNAYDVRSRFIHGDEITKKFAKRDNLVEISVYIDSILRRIFEKILFVDFEIFQKSNKELKIYYDTIGLN